MKNNKRKMKKLEYKIRELAGDNFHLFVGDENMENWTLYRIYADFNRYMDESNKPVMSSKENTIEELMTFLKQYREINYPRYITKYALCLNVVIWVLVMINIATIKNDVIAGFLIGAMLANLTFDFIVEHIQGVNFKTHMRLNKFDNKKDIEDLIKMIDEKVSKEKKDKESKKIVKKKDSHDYKT